MISFSLAESELFVSAHGRDSASFTIREGADPAITVEPNDLNTIPLAEETYCTKDFMKPL